MPDEGAVSRIVRSASVRTDLHPVPVLLIDGGSGSGKSTLANAVAARWPEPLTLIRLEAIYPGWGGLQAASDHIHDNVLEPLASGRTPRWQRWNWETGEAGEWTEVDPSLPVIIEGSGCLNTPNRDLATFAVWIEVDEPTRKARALARDGDLYAQHWDEWAVQEADFAARCDPSSLADVVLCDPIEG
jgi:energy-coupling factor transporter ATP-binding protein EcfA2